MKLSDAIASACDLLCMTRNPENVSPTGAVGMSIGEMSNKAVEKGVKSSSQCMGTVLALSYISDHLKIHNVGIKGRDF